MFKCENCGCEPDTLFAVEDVVWTIITGEKKRWVCPKCYAEYWGKGEFENDPDDIPSV